METLNSKHLENRNKVIRLKNYMCQKCKVKQYSIGYYDAFNNFIDCDAYMCAYARRNDINLIRIHLRVYHNNKNIIDFNIKNLSVLCPRCYNEKEREYKRLRIATKGIIFPRC